MVKLIAFLAMTSLVAAPVSASVREAAMASGSDRAQMQTSMFAGVTYRVGLGSRRANQRSGQVSLKLAGMVQTPMSPRLHFSHGLEIAGGKTGRPTLYLAGQDVGAFRGKSNLSGTTTAIIVGVLLVSAVAAAVIVSEATKCEEDCAPAGGS